MTLRMLVFTILAAVFSPSGSAFSVTTGIVVARNFLPDLNRLRRWINIYIQNSPSAQTTAGHPGRKDDLEKLWGVERSLVSPTQRVKSRSPLLATQSRASALKSTEVCIVSLTGRHE